MSKLRRVWALVALFAWPAPIASAQEAQAEVAAEAPSPAADAPAAAEAPAAPSTPRYAPRGGPPPPIMVAVLATGRVSDELVAAAQQALVDQLTAMSGGRPVHALGAQALRDAMAACRDDACVGAQLAQAGAQAGVLLRLTGRGRRPLSAAIEIRDPVSGALRREAVTGELPLVAAEVAGAMTALSAQLEGAMPNPPPPPATLLVTVNVDGARVQIDGEDIGTSPVASVEVAEGQHEVVVIAPGHLSVRRPSRVQPGEQARLDVTLQPLDGAAGQAGASVAVGGGGATGGGDGGDDLLSQWWFWTAIGGGGAVLLGVLIGIGVAVADASSTPMQLDPTGIMLPPISGGM